MGLDGSWTTYGPDSYAACPGFAGTQDGGGAGGNCDNFIGKAGGKHFGGSCGPFPSEGNTGGGGGDGYYGGGAGAVHAGGGGGSGYLDASVEDGFFVTSFNGAAPETANAHYVLNAAAPVKGKQGGHGAIVIVY